MIAVVSHMNSPPGVFTTGIPPGHPCVACYAIGDGEAAQAIRDGLVVEITGELAREVGLAHPIDAIDFGAR